MTNCLTPEALALFLSMIMAEPPKILTERVLIQAETGVVIWTWKPAREVYCIDQGKAT
jgi:hypothetical protein